MQSYRFKVIHILGRHKYVREACHEMFNLCYNYDIIREPIQLLQTNPTTYGITLDPFISIYRFDKDLNNKIIFNCLPSVGVKGVEHVNDYVTQRSHRVYENINLFVNLKTMNSQYKQEILERTNVYHDVYSMEDSEEDKVDLLRRHIGENTLLDVP